MSNALDTIDMNGLVADTAAISDTPLEYTADGWCVLHRDPLTGREVHALEEGDKMHIREVADVEALVDENTAIRAENAGKRHGDGLSLVARLPEHVYHNRLSDAIREGDRDYVRRWLNDADHSAFRVREGRI